MQRLEVSLPTAAENIALDDVLSEFVERRRTGVLRLWECPEFAVSLGRSSRVAEEVDVERCRRDGVPVVRRSSGGGVVLLGPGCLCYSLLLPLESEDERFHMRKATDAIMTRIAAALQSLAPGVEAAGTSDLAIGRRKVSGNAQRWLRRTLLHHGTLLYDFPLDRVPDYLKRPLREPDYRARRSHREFMANLNVTAGRLRQAIGDAWNTTAEPVDVPLDDVQTLVAERFGCDSWNLKR